MKKLRKFYAPSKQAPRSAVITPPSSTSVNACHTLGCHRHDVQHAIKSFRPGAAGGLDGLRLQHLKGLTSTLMGYALPAFPSLVMCSSLSPHNVIIKYANDTTLLVGQHSSVDIIREYDNICAWSARNKLTINSDKTKEIIFHQYSASYA